ncbi:MAG: hypothetical protein ABI675_23500 [Chitinophagaceae bacterium]
MSNHVVQSRRKACYWVITGLILATYSCQLQAQQNIINKKDVTRPEASKEYNSFNLASFTAIQQNGYNEIQWPASEKSTDKKFTIEYSYDGINFLSGPQVLSTNGMFNYKELIRDTRPLLYRIRTEDITGTVSYSGAFLPKGIAISPVQIQTNMITGNIINANAQFPVERITVVSSDGIQLLTKDVNGVSNFIPVAIPTLKQGIYFINFYGVGWKSTSRFMIS